MKNELITNTKKEPLKERRDTLKADLFLLREIEAKLEKDVSLQGEIAPEQEMQLDYLAGQIRKAENELAEQDKIIAEMLIKIQDIDKKQSIEDHGQRAFNSVAERETLKQVTSKTVEYKASFRRTKQQIINYYQAQINLKRPNLKEIYSINQFLRVLGIQKTIEQVNTTERKVIKSFLPMVK